MMTAKLGLLALVMVSATGQDAPTPYDRFQLFNNCQPMRLAVEELPDAAADIKLTTERLVLAAESRLRGARLYTEDFDQPFLYLNVNVVGAAFNTSLEYRKHVLDPVTSEYFWTTTWDAGATGQHGGDAEYIVSDVSYQLDRFLTEYLRVNEAACSSR